MRNRQRRIGVHRYKNFGSTGPIKVTIGKKYKAENTLWFILGEAEAEQLAAMLNQVTGEKV